MRQQDKPLLLLAFSMVTVGVVAGIFCAIAVGLSDPVLGWIMGTITLSPLLIVLIFWLFILEHRGRK